MDISYRSPTFSFSRRWERNGPGPKVPHAFKYVNCRVDTSDVSYCNTTRGDLPETPASLDSFTQERLYSKLRSLAYDNMQLGADIGELHQTIDLIKTSVNMARHPIASLGKLMKRTGRGGARSLLKDVNDAFLQFTYGVKPLMQTVFDACEVAAKPFPRHRVRAGVKYSYIPPAYYNSAWPSSQDAMYQCVEYSGVYSGGFTVQLQNPNLFAVEQMGLLNPASIAWELTPFSFVVDWFIPVGKFINSFSDYAGCSLTNNYQTFFARGNGYKVIINRVDSERNPLPNIRGDYRTVICERTVGPLTFPHKRMIDLKTDQSRTHIMNGISLILSLKL